MKKIHITTLGCSKNVVDSEVLTGQLESRQYEIVDKPQDSDVLIINTCGFIEEAKKESIQAIFEALALKKEDPAKKVFIAGCLTQRYKKEIEKEIPEADAIFGTEDYTAILKALGEKHAAVDNLHRLRKLSTPRHSAYLKISEGCNHNCAFCAIPGIRGKHRSRTIESLVEESKLLAERGAKELILISQDSSYYGKDLYGKQSIVKLLDHLCNIPELEWIRVLYWYPTNFPVDVLDLMGNGNKLVPYIDMPIQHISEKMLRLMRRGDTRESILKLYNLMRNKLPDIALRTTLILGHPGETERDFDELHQFIKDIEFDRLGTFTYSDEDNTPAFLLPDKVNPEVARERQSILMETQRDISLLKNNSYIGKTFQTLIDSFDADMHTYTGRTFRDAPEIDNEVVITIDEKNKTIKPGDFVMVQIEDASEYELYSNFIV
ncbi:MAG: 30S ribosomal protein S12 methylthiotransferase RimO [Calditrichaceae bacterium]|nr:30S ribosomal protein S12 methylthiotransferase RimO [Calditrichaceae bacterium]HES60102.1 30S ribosomal protein S12 methylthiotransferase RimO [Caldithrix sp.]